MRITWLGQAGLIFDDGKTKIMIDPYFSDSVGTNDQSKYRRVKVKEHLYNIEPDFMVFTHDHLDHYDPETAQRFLGKGRSKKTVLSPFSVWKRVRALGGDHNFIMFDRGTEWTEGDIRFRAIRANHSDPYAIGIIIEKLSEKKLYYVTGDTLYNREIFGELPQKIDAVFLPINGSGNNMNATDAQRFAEECKATVAVPYHYGMLDDITAESFDFKNKIVFNIYEERDI